MIRKKLRYYGTDLLFTLICARAHGSLDCAPTFFDGQSDGPVISGMGCRLSNSVATNVTQPSSSFFRFYAAQHFLILEQELQQERKLECKYGQTTVTLLSQATRATGYRILNCGDSIWLDGLAFEVRDHGSHDSSSSISWFRLNKSLTRYPF